MIAVATNKLILDVIDLDGTNKQVEIVMAFESETTKKEYVVYTKNEVSADNRILLYASAMVEKEGKIILEDISDEEWLIVKGKMREVMHNGEANS